jgi:hypothetical protein|tara:strand:- start:67 stop:1245 length:1179 start_codon:yes stop_codon:yes gene_type:complete
MSKYILFLFLSIPFISSAQQTINGIVLDKDDLTPLAGVHLYLKHAQKGTISNNQGEYQFTIDTTNISDTLCFSYLGYATVIKPLHNTSNLRDTIYMKAISLFLAEMTVSANPLSAKEIIDRAIANYDDNYLPLNYKGTLKQATYLNDTLNRLLLAEVVFIKKSKNVRVYKDTIAQYKKINTKNRKYLAGLSFSTLIDLINIKKILLFYSKKIETLDSVIINNFTDYYGGNEVYNLSFLIQRKLKIGKINLIIDKSSFALIQYESDIKTAKEKYPKKSWNTVFDSTGIKIICPPIVLESKRRITFKPFGNKWMFSDGNFLGSCNIIENDSIIRKITYDIGFIANSFNTQKISRKLKLNLEYEFPKQIENRTPASSFKEISLNKKELEFIKTKL